MNKWINEEVTLYGEVVNLIPMEVSHFDALNALAKDPRIWEFYIYNAANTERFARVFHSAFPEKEAGTLYPFSIYHIGDEKIIGSTRLLDINLQHRKLEIGTTWLHPDYWATAVNLECKLLLLTYCFETMNAVRVQLKTDERNIRSRKAIAKIGATFEGILRNDMIRDDHTRRHSAYFSILEEEWAEKKEILTERYWAKRDY